MNKPQIHHNRAYAISIIAQKLINANGLTNPQPSRMPHRSAT